jgi:arabinan endo-1,5-alpha-L-arabinosidase
MAFLISLALISACSESPEEPSDKSRPTCVAASDSIVGWWPLDQLGSAAEELVEDNHGDYAGSPLEVDGKVGGALRFYARDGEMIEVPDPGDNWIFDITGDITLETWIRRDSNQADQQVLVGKYGAYYLGCRGGKIFALMGSVDFVGDTSLPVGEWFHVAVTYDIDDIRIATIYLNGEVDGNVANNGTNVAESDGYIYIGGLPGQQYFWGSIDEVSIYKTALSASEIREIYNRGSLGKCK